MPDFFKKSKNKNVSSRN